MKVFGSCCLIVAALMILVPAVVQADDTSEADGCAGCHSNPFQILLVNEWKASGHGDSYKTYKDKAYCAGCHAPMQAPLYPDPPTDPPTSLEADWEHVTCGACHPSHGVRVANGTPLGIFTGYDETGAKTWSAVFPEDANDLCTSCHTGHGTSDFQSFGKVMYEHKGVRCMDCHMPKIPMTVEGDDPNTPDVVEETWTKMLHTHSFDPVAGLPYSCGTNAGGCHSNHKDKWAVKQISKGLIHGKKSH